MVLTSDYRTLPLSEVPPDCTSKSPWNKVTSDCAIKMLGNEVSSHSRSEVGELAYGKSWQARLKLCCTLKVSMLQLCCKLDYSQYSVSCSPNLTA